MSNPFDLRQHVKNHWNCETARELDMTLEAIFLTVHDFDTHGAIPLNDVFDLHAASLLLIDRIQIEPFMGEFTVVELAPEVLAESRRRNSTEDEAEDHYLVPNEMDERDDYNLEDYRGGDLYLMSEARLRRALAHDERSWLIYRTPYRPETEAELKRPL